MIRSLLLALFLIVFGFSVRAQVTADETLQLVATIPSSWGSPLGPPLANGTRLSFHPHSMVGPGPLACRNASFEFVRLPPEGFFEGMLPAPALQSARALGLPQEIIAQRVTCPNGGFDVLRAVDGRAWLALDHAVLQWERTDLASGPEAIVQRLLIHHFANGLSFSKANVAAQASLLGTSLVAKLNRWFAATAQSDEPPYLNGDPYTDSQEPPERFELASARIKGAAAEVTVTYDGELIEPYTVRFQLVREKSDWRIDDLVFRDGGTLSSALRE